VAVGLDAGHGHVPGALDGSRVAEVDLEIADAPAAHGAQHPGQVAGRVRVRQVKSGARVPAHRARVHRLARPRVTDHPVRMGGEQLAGASGQHRRDPDAGPPAGAPYPGDQAGQVGEAAGRRQPVAGTRLVAVIDLDDADRDAQLVHRGQVGQHVGLGHARVVLIPRAPDRRDRAQYNLCRGLVRPPAQRSRDPAGTAILRPGDRGVGADDQLLAAQPGLDDGHPAACIRGAEYSHRPAVGGIDGQQPRALEHAGGRRLAVLAVDRQRLRRGDLPRPGRRRERTRLAPRLPALGIHPRSRRVDADSRDLRHHRSASALGPSAPAC
jgi:hypothetical protein